MTVRAPSLPISSALCAFSRPACPTMSPLFSASSCVDLRVGGLAHVAEQVRAELVGRILARRHLLHDDVRQLEIEPPGGDRRHLRERRVLDDDDRPVRRLVPVAIDDLAHVPLVHACHGGRACRIVRSRSVVFSRTIETLNAGRFSTSTRPLRSKSTPRGARSGQLALVVVLGHLAELLVLDDLEEPEASDEQAEEHDDRHPHPGNAGRERLAFFDESSRRHFLIDYAVVFS